MPKNRKSIKANGIISTINVASKLMIGSRKSGTSAMLMSNKRLLEVLDDESSKRYWDNARTVLNSRPVSA